MADNRMERNYYVTLEWLALKIRKKSLAEYLLERDIHSVAIYGMGYLGELLWEDLKDTSISVAYGIDRNAPALLLDLDV